MWSSWKCVHDKWIALQVSPNIRIKLYFLSDCSKGNEACLLNLYSAGEGLHGGIWFELSSWRATMCSGRIVSKEKRKRFPKSLPGTCSSTAAVLDGQNLSLPPLSLLYPARSSWDGAGEGGGVWNQETEQVRTMIESGILLSALLTQGLRLAWGGMKH